jgi:hypothetical protein
MPRVRAGLRQDLVALIMGGLAVGEVQAWDALALSSGQAFRGGRTVGAGIEATAALPRISISGNARAPRTATPRLSR